MSIFYFNKVLKIIENSRPLRNTVVGVAKQTGYAAAGTAAGGLIMGPLGGLLGGALGLLYGYSYNDDYDNLINAMRSMTDEEKCAISSQIQTLVGSITIEAFVQYIETEVHRQRLIELISSYVGKA